MINIICATKGRPEQAKRIIKDIVDTSPCHLYMTVSWDRKEFNALRLFVKKMETDQVHLIFDRVSTSFAAAVNRQWGKIRYKAPKQNHYAIATADDMEFLPGWHEAAMDCYQELFPEEDGALFLNDLTSRNQIGMTLVTAKFCDKYMGGWLVTPYYWCNWIDMEYDYISKLHGKRGYCPNAKVRHLLVDWDEVKYSEHMVVGTAIFESRKQRNFCFEPAPWRYWK